MKTMTCLQLGGACETEFRAETFEEMAKLSQKHGMEMFQKGDKPHIAAMQKMQNLMVSPIEMGNWMNEKKAIFDSL